MCMNYWYFVLLYNKYLWWSLALICIHVYKQTIKAYLKNEKKEFFSSFDCKIIVSCFIYNNHAIFCFYFYFNVQRGIVTKGMFSENCCWKKYGTWIMLIKYTDVRSKWSWNMCLNMYRGFYKFTTCSYST